MITALLLSHAFAGDARLKVLIMPVTPSDPVRTEFLALIPAKGAAGREWASETPGYLCAARGEFVEISVKPENWPSELPKAVWCTDGTTRVKAKIEIDDMRLRPMFVGDGSLVLPREKGESSIYKGAPPRTDVGVQQGKTSALTTLCKIDRGPTLEVIAYPNTPDGVGSCTLTSTRGEEIRFPVVVRTAKRAR